MMRARRLPKNLKSVSLLFLFRVRLAGYAISYFTPTAAVGGEITKISLLTAKGEVTETASARTKAAHRFIAG